MTSDTRSTPPAHWIPLALARDLPPGTSAGVVCDGAEIVLWRDSAGALHAWEDRCPHRGMKLSFGFVRGDRIACLYHGWEYGRDAVCQYIPAHPDLDVPSSIRVGRYAVAESAGMVWVAAEGTSAAPPPGPDAVTPLRSLFVDAPRHVVADLLLAEGLSGGAQAAASRAEGPLVRFRQGDLQVLAGLHSESPMRTGVHLVIDGQPGADNCAALIPATAALRRNAQALAQRTEAA